MPDGAGGVIGHLDVAIGRGLGLGGEVGWMAYGDQTRTVPLGPLIPELPNASIEVNTTNAIVTLHARLRALPRPGRWRPYLDGLLGFSDLYTRSAVEGESNCFGQPCENVISGYRHTHARDFSASYGGGAGVMSGFSGRPRAPRLDIALRYLRGGVAVYLTPGALQVDGDQLVRLFSRSRTDLVHLYIGVAFGR